MKKIIYTAIYPFNKFIDRRLPEVIELFLGTDEKRRSIAIYKLLMDLESTYPDFYNWYNKKVINDLKMHRNNRNILFAVSMINDNGKIKKRLTGIAIIKRNHQERKICTFRVFPEYQKQGVGTALLKLCFNYLETERPLISISEKSIGRFSAFIDKYNWTLCQILPGYYKKGITEFVFNGFLK